LITIREFYVECCYLSFHDENPIILNSRFKYYGKRGDQLILISETQLDKMIKVKRGEIIIFRKFKVLTVGSKSEDKVRSNNGQEQRSNRIAGLKVQHGVTY
jgi:hypothetical protein